MVASTSRGAADGELETLLAPVNGLPVVLVGSTLSRRDVDDALEAGLRGFVASEHVEARLVATVLAVASGQLAIPWEVRRWSAPRRPRA